MSKWDMIKLGDLCSVITKGTTPTTIGYEFQNNGINFIKIESISDNGTFNINKFEHISDECNQKMKRSQLYENDILFSIAGAIGKIGCVTKDILPANTNQALAIIRLDSKNILHSYLIYCLKSNIITKQYDKNKQGVAQINLSLKNISDLQIPLPPLKNQKQIAENLDKLTRTIDLCNAIIEKLDLLVKARFVEMFGDIYTNECNFPIRSLSDYIVFITSGSRGWAKYCVDDGKEWFITIKNVKDCRISTNNMQPVNAPDNMEAKRTKVEEGDLLISITADLGRTGVVTREIAEHGAYINQHLTCVRLDQSKLVPLFVSYFMESASGKPQFESKNQTGVKAGLNFDSIKSLKLLIPPIALQKQFTNFVEQTEKTKLKVKKVLEKVEILKSTLMQKYFK